jgi:hypothetical protein
MITCNLTISTDRVSFLVEYFKDEITVTDQGDGYSRVELKVKDQMDVLYVFHAGVNAGVSFGLWGPKGKPEEKATDLVGIERG